MFENISYFLQIFKINFDIKYGMELEFQLIDCDYVIVDNLPIIRLFGKTRENKTVCAFHEGFLPYFYILPENKQEAVAFLKKNFSNLIVNIEEEEKFLPIGFQNKKTKVLKIVLKNPSKVVSVREELRRKDFIKEIYEADILFKYRFMADFSLSGMRWMKISGNGTSTTTVKTDKIVEAKFISAVDGDTNVSFKYMGVDIEIAYEGVGALDSKKDKIAIISLSFLPAFNGHNTLVLVSKSMKKMDKDVIVLKDEKQMLEEFIKILDLFDPDFICGYNINNFDLPFIVDRLRENKISRAMGRCRQKQVVCKKFGMRFKNSITGRVVVDVYDLIKESVGKGLLRIKRFGLGDVSKVLLNEDKIGIPHSEIPKYWNGDEIQIKKLIEYARRDAELVLKLLLGKDMLAKFIELSKVSGLLLQDVLNGGEATRVENLLLREFDRMDYVIPCKPSEKEILRRRDERQAKGFKGALVLEPEIGLHTTNIIYLDFRSMYPSIFVAWNICPTTLILKKKKMEVVDTPYGARFIPPKIKEGLIPRIVNLLMKQRDKIKKQMEKANTTERKVLDAKQYALKIMANAFYGYTGYLRARFYALDIANAITSCGRDILQRTKKFVETDERLKVVYGDTDSILVKLQTTDLEEAFKFGKELGEKINKELKGVVQIKIENVFRTMLILTKKRYVGWSFEKLNGTWKDKFVMKGIETVRRDWCGLVEETLLKTLEIILKEQDKKKAFNYVKEILNKLEKNEVPIEKLVISKGISKPIKEYRGIQPHVELVKKLRRRSPASAPGIGDRVGFVILRGPQLISNRAEDPDYVKRRKLKVDSKYYIESQLLPPLERVFEAIGVSKSELIGLGRQMLLAEAIKAKKKKVLNSIEGFVCEKCKKDYRRVPLIGKCSNCGGEILFYSGDARSRFFES